MTTAEGYEQVRREVLDLVAYEDGAALFEGTRVSTLGGGAQSGVTVTLSLADWTRLGRPTEVLVAYAVSVT